MRPEAFFDEHRIELVSGDAVTRDRPRRESGRARPTASALAYDHLVLATGARNRVPPLPGIELDGVCYLRNLAETEALQGAARRLPACGRHRRRLYRPRIRRDRPRQGRAGAYRRAGRPGDGRVVCPDTSAYFADAHRETGVEFSFGARVERLGGEGGKVTHVVLGDGRSLPADLVADQHRRRAQRGARRRRRARGRERHRRRRAAADRRPRDLGDRRLRRVSLAPFAEEPGAARSGAERRRPRALRRRAAWSASRMPTRRCRGSGASRGRCGCRSPGSPPGSSRSCCAAITRSGEYSAFCYAGDKLLGIELINKPADHAFARRLLAAGRSVTPGQAADLSFDLRAAAMARPA